MKKIIYGALVGAVLFSSGAIPAFADGYNQLSPDNYLDGQTATIQVEGQTSSGASSSSINSSCGNLASSGFSGVARCILSILDAIVVILMAAAVVVIIWGAFEMLSSEEKRKKGRDTIIYGIIGLFVMVSVWGLVNILTNTFKLRGSYMTPPPLHQP